MTIAYIISAYQLPGQLARLVARLQGPGCVFFVHVDLNAPPDMFDPIATSLGRHENVHLLTRHACPWGGFGHVQATLKGLARVVESPTPADYVVLLTGQDYPIKSNARIEAFLEQQAGRSFMNHQPLPVAGLPDGGYARLRRPVPRDLNPHFGSGYWCLHGTAVEHIVEFVRRRPDYISCFEQAEIPDEMFFQTILINSPLRDTVVNDDLRLIKWPGPAVLTSADWDDILASPDLFARKFDERVDATILARIDGLIG